MCAAAGVESLAQLDLAAIERAVERLLSLITSDAAFQQREFTVGKIVKKTAFITSEMSVIFTNNNALSNPSNKGVVKKQKYEARVRGKMEALRKTLQEPGDPVARRCFVDGNPACFSVGNDEFPLVDSRSKRNFHPALDEGHHVGALTALAVEFFPLSVLRTGPNSGFFWFVHTAHEPIAIACAALTEGTMSDAVAKKSDFGFFGDWSRTGILHSRGKETALVALVRELTCGTARRDAGSKPLLSRAQIKEIDFPVAAYIFSNDSRSPAIELHDLPHPLFSFFSQLHGESEVLRRLNFEVLGSEKKGWLLARAMLAQKPIVGLSLIHPRNDLTGRLRGGWIAQAHYAREVCHVSAQFIRDVEAVSARIHEHEKAKDFTFALQRAGGSGEVRRVLLRACKANILDEQQFERLLPPDAPGRSYETRDFLLAALYERAFLEIKEQPFVAWDGREDDADRPKSDILQLVEAIGPGISADERRKRYAHGLAHATKSRDMRTVLLRAAREGLLSWEQWVEAFPPSNNWKPLLMRDYLLAYLYTHAPDAEELPDPLPVDTRELRDPNAVTVA